MKTARNKTAIAGILLIALFLLWTHLIQTVDVQAIGPNGSSVGFARFNGWFHQCTGVSIAIYTITDWLGLVPVTVGMVFAVLGLIQWIKRKNLFKVDADILLLGVYYLVVVFFYLYFEMRPINYRPVLIGGRLEASYPSSTTLLVLGVMPTLGEQAARRVKNAAWLRFIRGFAAGFSLLMVSGRLVCGVHWLTDIVGSVLLSAGLFSFYRAAVMAVTVAKCDH